MIIECLSAGKDISDTSLGWRWEEVLCDEESDRACRGIVGNGRIGRFSVRIRVPLNRSAPRTSAALTQRTRNSGECLPLHDLFRPSTGTLLPFTWLGHY